MVVSMQTEQKGIRGMMHKMTHKESKPVPQPTVDMASQKYQAKDIIRPRGTSLEQGRDINAEFTVQKNTETVLAERVQNFITTMQDNELHNGPMLNWQREFIAQFQALYPNAKPEELKANTLAFVQTNQGLIASLKIAEWELATYQRATGVYMKDVQSHATRFHSALKTAGRAVSVAGESVAQRFRKAGAAQTALEADQKAASGRSIREQDGNYYFRTRVGQDEVRRRVWFGANPNRDAQVDFNAANLDIGQRRFLARRGLLNVDAAGNITTRTITGQDAESERQRIADLVTSISQARVDVYQATGKPNISLNTIDRNNANYVTQMQAPHLRIEERAAIAGPSNARAEIMRAITIINDDLRTRATAELTKRQNQEREQQVKTTVEKEITAANASAVQTPEQSRRLQELTQSIGELGTQIQTAQRPGEIRTQITTLESRRTDVQTEINRLAHANGFPGARDLVAESRQLPTLEAQRAELQRLRDARERRLNELRNIRNNPKGANVASIDAEILLHEGQLNTAYNGGAGIEVQWTTLNNQIIEVQRHLASQDIAPLNTESTNISTQIGTRQGELITANNEAEALRTRLNVGRPPPPIIANIADLLPERQATLTNQQAEQRNIELIGIGRDRRGQVLKTYNEHVLSGNDPEDIRGSGQRTNLEGINLRAQRAVLANVDPNFLPLEFSADYAAYPQAYLRAIQVMFGVQAVRPGSEVLFQEAVRMLPPEKLLRIINEMNPLAPQLTDFTTLTPANITPALITQALSTFQAEALVGDTGQYSDFSSERTNGGAPRPLAVAQAIVRPQFERVRVVQRDAAFDPNAVGPNGAERDRLVAVMTHYEDMDDLVRRIVSNWNVLGFAGGGIAGGIDNFPDDTVIARAKRFAEEVDNRCRWRVALRAQEAAARQAVVPTPPATVT